MLKFENKTNGRFFYLSVNQDLLNDLVLTITRGGNHHRVIRHFGFSNEESLKKEIERLSKRRIKRGYSLISGLNSHSPFADFSLTNLS